MQVQKQRTPPINVAWGQAMLSIRKRPWRQFFTALGVFLGIAFFASVRTFQMLSPVTAGDIEAIESASRMKYLVALSLVMCLVGITNAMLMSVTERFKEIGTMKCLGATDAFVVMVFFLESLFIGVLSSLFGSICGILISYVVILITSADYMLTNLLTKFGMIVAVSLVLGVVMTVIAAIIPAFQAAKMPAASALRVEI